jgi:hypothetical protein
MLTLEKDEIAFNALNRLLPTKSKVLVTPTFKDTNITTNLSSLPLFSEDFHTQSNLSNLNDFNLYDTELELDLFDDSYANSKFIGYIHYLNYSNILNLDLQSNFPLSYIQVLNAFRADYEEVVETSNTLSMSDNNNVVDSNDVRSSNFIKLRSTAKNAIATFNALQKVFRP